MSLRNNIFRIIFPALFLYLTANFFAQPFDRELNAFPVQDESGLLQNIFSGGHNNIEHQFADIDNDDDFDIFFLDSDRTYGWFENTGDKFNPVFELSLSNPPGLFFSNWFYLLDIDADGDLDYLTGNIDLISFYRNDGSPETPLFTLEQDTVLDFDGEPIYSEFGSNPVFADIDNDGDFDFFSGNSAGTVRFYDNVGTAQNFNFQFITNEWQGLYIVGTLNDDPRHGASSLDFVDIDNDDDPDLFWGDFFSNSLYFIENQGTASNPDMVRISDVFPVNADSVNTSGFNMPRFKDIDGDGDFDLFVSVLYDPTVPQSLIYYENIGNVFSANHIFITKDFLKTLDVSNNSAPTFADIDADGDLDLFIGSLNNPFGSIHFLENTGTNSQPSYYYSDSSFFNIESDLSVIPAFSDLDNDLDLDLLIGQLDGTLMYFVNTGTVTSPEFSSGITLLNNLNQIIDIGSSSSPFLFDVDNDLDMDLFIGGFNGKFYFYENTGTQASYSFTLNNTYFGNLDVGDNSTPFILDFNEDGFYDLFSGNRSGEFFYYKNDGSNSTPIWTQITNHFIDDNFGGYTFPCFADIDADSDLDLFLGNVKGGLYFYNNSEITNVVEWGLKPIDNYSLEAFPNPFNPVIWIRIENKQAVTTTLSIFNLLGEEVKTIFHNYLPTGIHTFYWHGDNDSGEILPSGIYLVRTSSKFNFKAIKISFLK